MAKIINITVNDVGDPEAITVQTVCRKITIGENPSVAGWPTTDLKVYRPDFSGNPRQIPGGLSYPFEKPLGQYYNPGDVAGYVATDSGSTTVFQDEE